MVAACAPQDLSREVYVPPAARTSTAPLPPSSPRLEVSAPAAPSAGPARAPAAGNLAPGGKGVVGPEGAQAFDKLSSSDRERLRGARIFFGHQSVGQNILDGAEQLGFRFRSVSAGEEYDGDVRLGEALLGRNGDGVGKVRAYVDLLDRGGVGRRVDAAGMKLCYSDVEGTTDLEPLKAAYASAVDRLTQAFPHLRLLHVTPPLESDDGPGNTKRLALGTWLKERYGTRAVVLDLAAVESTSPTGAPCRKNNVPALCDALREDHGHLSEGGSRHVAKAFLYAVVKAL